MKIMKILVTGAAGQIGSDLIPYLREKYPTAEIVVTRSSRAKQPYRSLLGEVVATVDVEDESSVQKLMQTHKPDVLYHLAGILSATGEKNPQHAWDTNMVGLKHVFDSAVEQGTQKVFWPSSIAAFGSTTPREQTPQHTIMEPSTMYGINKVSGELLTQYYIRKYKLDIRSVRFPGLISYKTPPGGGTTDYAVDMFYNALRQEPYTCFVSASTVLPMMYMDDAIHAIDLLMAAPAEHLTVQTSYNLAALHFSAAELAGAIQKSIPSFSCTYEPDYRQQIADSWPRTIDDSQARKDWSWKPEYDLQRMVTTMIQHLREKLAIA